MILFFVGEKGVFILHGDKLSGAFEVFQSGSKNVHGGFRLGFALDTQVDVVLRGMDYAVPEGRGKKIGVKNKLKVKPVSLRNTSLPTVEIEESACQCGNRHVNVATPDEYSRRV